MDLFQAIKERRSIRRYKPTPISEEALRTVLEAARWAPSWANSQCWRFVVVRHPEVKERLAQVLGQGNAAIPAIKAAPIVIVACARLGRSGYRDGVLITDKGDWFMFDVALAMQNLTLAAYALGLGTVHVGRFDAKRAAQVLGVPEGVVVVEIMPLGYPDEAPPPRPRRELEKTVSYDKYDTGLSEA